MKEENEKANKSKGKGEGAKQTKGSNLENGIQLKAFKRL